MPNYCKRNLSFDKFGKFLFIFILLQVQFTTKGSNALPGNSHSNSHLQESGVGATPPIQSEADGIADDEHQAVVSFQELQEEIPPKSQELVQLAPKPRHAHVSSDSIGSSFEDFVITTLNSNGEFSVHSLNKLREKSISRQSQDGESVGFDFIELTSMTSDSSRLAKFLVPKTESAHGIPVNPISFDELCKLLRKTGDRIMSDEELIELSNRIVSAQQTFHKVLNDLPLFIRVADFDKQNATKINGIIYNYWLKCDHWLKSDYCMLELQDAKEQPDNNTEGSICSKHGSESTISSIPSTPNSSPPPASNEKQKVFDDLESSNELHPPLHVSHHTASTVQPVKKSYYDEVEAVQSHVSHPELLIGLMPRVGIGRGLYNPFLRFPHVNRRFAGMNVVIEESKSADDAVDDSADEAVKNGEEDGSFGTKIEEID
jgi:hypothetical protein